MLSSREGDPTITYPTNLQAHLITSRHRLQWDQFPDNTTSPFPERGTACSVLASHVMKLTGLPAAAAPVPLEITSPFLQTVISQLIRSTTAGLVAAPSFRANQLQERVVHDRILYFDLPIFDARVDDFETRHYSFRCRVADQCSSNLDLEGPSLRRKAISPSARG